MKENYLVITPFFPTDNSFRGSFIYDQVKALNSIGKFNIIILKSKTIFSKDKDYSKDGISVYYFTNFYFPSNFLPGLLGIISQYIFKLKLKKLGISIQNLSYVHVHSTSLGYLGIALKKLNTSILSILQHHGLDVLNINSSRFNRFKWHRSISRSYGIKVCNKFDLHVGVSIKTIESLLRYNRVRIKDSYVLYNGVDKNKFFPNLNKEKNSEFKIGCIANFIEIKDQMTLIKAVELVIKRGFTKIKVEFIGSGPTLFSCVRYVNDNNLSMYFEFKSEIKHEFLCLFYNSLNLFVLPSYYESFGCVYVEANSCGIPFIAVKDQGIEEILSPNDFKHFLIDKRDYKCLADLILCHLSQSKKQELNIDLNINVLIMQFLDKLTVCKNKLNSY